MSRQGLTEEEEQYLLLLLEGDVSDIDVEESDVEIDLEIPDVSTVVDLDAAAQNIAVGYEANNREDDYSSEDDIPLSRFFQKEIRKKKRNKNNQLRWCPDEIAPVAADCNSNFSDPPDPAITPLAYFKYFFDDSLISFIVHQTNLYSVEKTGNSINTNQDEIEQFIGMHILSGIIKMPSYRMYWAETTRYAPIAETMSRNRFDKLRNFLHLNDNSKMKPRGDVEYDKLFKIRPVLDSVRANLATIEPEEHNCVDEIIIPFKGRSSLKQYIKNKPHKWGIKMFARAGSSGIIYDFEIYVGKGTVQETSELGISGDIVMRLCKNIPKHENYKLYCDNWFSSPNLFLKLKEIGILATGTVRSNRLPNCKLKNDKDLKKEGRGSFDYRTEVNNNLFAIKWYDNKPVHLLSTYRGSQPVDNVKRWSVAEKQYVEVSRPNVITQYNTYMGGVDLHDMLVSLYRINFVVKRYYLRIFFNIIDMCVVNAWLLYRRHMTQMKEKHKSLIEFRSDVAHGLIKAGKENKRKRGRPSSATSSTLQTPPPKKKSRTPLPLSDVQYDGLGHWPIHIEPKQRCRLCVHSYSRVKCEKCDVALCFTKDKNCFKSFHCK